METGSGADSPGCGGVAVGNKANGLMGVGGVGGVSAISDAMGVRAGAGISPAHTTLSAHVKAPMRSAVKAKSYLSSPTPKILSRIRFLRRFYCRIAKIP